MPFLGTTELILNKQHKTLDIITLFHKPSLPSSTRVLNLLRTASANASEAANATLDQASDTTPTPSGSGSSVADGALRDDFEIEVTESLPTPDQLSTIIDYLGSKGVKAGAVVQGAASKDDALKKLSESGFARPIVRSLPRNMINLCSDYSTDNFWSDRLSTGATEKPS